MIKTPIITVKIKYLETEQKFSGNLDQVWICINKFFSQIHPSLEILKSIILTVDLNNLIRDSKNLIAVAPEGPIILVSRQKLTDNEILTLHLIATFIANKLGYSKNYSSKVELQKKLGKTSKITSTRLGELIREGLVTKTETGNFKITTLGITRFQKEMIPEIRKKF
ncbi:hypothetical protein KJN74_04455 [Candidatus Bathyarchaeota archaeon]|nr:hypothetical protein [Candidatus Bathyarchaeota archaeon]